MKEKRERVRATVALFVPGLKDKERLTLDWPSLSLLVRPFVHPTTGPSFEASGRRSIILQPNHGYQLENRSIIPAGSLVTLAPSA